MEIETLILTVIPLIVSILIFFYSIIILWKKKNLMNILLVLINTFLFALTILVLYNLYFKNAYPVYYHLIFIPVMVVILGVQILYKKKKN